MNLQNNLQRKISNFWKSWSAHNICINGYHKANDIANTFREHYAKIFTKSADEQTKV